jgi:hypothetical protein
VASGPEGVRSLPQAAHEAVRAAGTEVSGAEVDGREHGPAGRWAQLRRHPWFGEQRFLFGQRPAFFGHRPAARSPRASALTNALPHVTRPVRSGIGRSASSAVGWTPAPEPPAVGTATPGDSPGGVAAPAADGSA